MKKDSAQFAAYNRLVHPERVRFMRSPGIQFYTGQLSKKDLHAFLIVWSHFSIKMTEHVEEWIARAGKRCVELGFEKVGAKLKHHAAQESDHDLMLVEDLAILLEKWNSTYGDQLTTKDLDAIATPRNTNAYVDIHENTISGPHPYGQVAIEYEIERISVGYGPAMVENVVNTLGDNFEAGIGFLAHHVLLDQGHTKFNKALMEECLAMGGDLQALATTGAAALRIYGEFLTECSVLCGKLMLREERGGWSYPSTI